MTHHLQGEFNVNEETEIHNQVYGKLNQQNAQQIITRETDGWSLLIKMSIPNRTLHTTDHDCQDEKGAKDNVNIPNSADISHATASGEPGRRTRHTPKTQTKRKDTLNTWLKHSHTR